MSQRDSNVLLFPWSKWLLLNVILEAKFLEISLNNVASVLSWYATNAEQEVLSKLEEITVPLCFVLVDGFVFLLYF